MKIEIWSDYACPFCYIGEKRLQRALAEVGDKNFELDPSADREVVSSTAERFAQKYGLSLAAATKRIEEISAMGRREGIDFKYLTTRYTNTFDAYFTKNLELSNREVLKKIAVECGLDGQEVDEVLAGDKYSAEIRAYEREAA